MKQSYIFHNQKEKKISLWAMLENKVLQAGIEVP